MPKKTRPPAWHPNASFGISLFLVTLATWAGGQMLLASSGARAANASPSKLAIRADGAWAAQSGPWTWTAPERDVIRSVTVTVGRGTRTFTADETSDCCVVRGIGTRTVEVRNGADDGFCDPITNVEFHLAKR